MTPQELQQIKQRFEIIGNSPQLNYAIQVAAQVSTTDLTVLITGESGSGKESFSKIIHSLSPRKFGQFIAINCGAIPEGTIDSELFGHEKGSFTGAVDSRKGYFEVTDGGTIFLDEIGEMPLGTQARLLRVLENGEFIKVGSSKVLKTNVRVVAATNVNLLDAVDKGKFRQDLYYRLNTVPIYVPPLRERGADIDLLFRKFASDFAEKYKVRPIQLLPDAKDILMRYSFPGNIRQLKNIAEQVSVLEVERDVNSSTLAKYLPQPHSSSLPSKVLDKQIEELYSEREILYKILFDLKRDMTELKKIVVEQLKSTSEGNETLLAHADFLSNTNEQPLLSRNIPQSTTNSFPFGNTPSSDQLRGMGGNQNANPFVVDTQKNHYPEAEDTEYAGVEDIIAVTQEESLLLDDKEKELIVKALKKNGNKRKYAALDLGISERTLYRKIKAYGIE